MTFYEVQTPYKRRWRQLKHTIYGSKDKQDLAKGSEFCRKNTPRNLLTGICGNRNMCIHFNFHRFGWFGNLRCGDIGIPQYKLYGGKGGVKMSCEHCKGYSVSHCPVCGEGEIEKVTCPECGGTGHGPYLKFDMIERKDIEVSELEWSLLPEDEDEAEELGQRYCKQDLEECWTCRGEGKVYADEI